MFDAVLIEAVKNAGAPGAVALVGHGDTVVFHGAAGLRQRVPAKAPAEKDTVYDLASLTKVVVTATALMQLRDRGALDLDSMAGAFIPVKELDRFTVRQLFTHTSGLPSYRQWYKEVGATDDVIQRIPELGLDAAPGAQRVYSDFGYMLLGRIVELVSGERLDQYARKHIFAPAGMETACFNPPEALRARCAATEQCPWRERMLVGEVHDEHAYAVGGISGHAGLFAPAADLGRFCAALLSGKLMAPASVEEMVRLGQLPYYPWQGLGWILDPFQGSTNGYLPGRHAFGHTGWTGTCLWTDLDTGYYAVLLSNTAHPTRDNRDNGSLRRTFFSAVEKTLYADRRNTKLGIDRVIFEEFEAVKGKRLAVLTNTAATTETGMHVLKALSYAPGFNLARIYSPEHGFDGSAEAGAAVASQGGATPIVSLYGKQTRPTREELKGLGRFVVDLPDIGARYYTYMHTMKACMEACVEADVPMLVLDRPNPLGGVVVEGPVAEVFGSAVCCAPIPVRHGLTLGELALFFKKQFANLGRLQLEVCAIDNWPRELQFEALALPWTAPSPNIPTPETALMYTGNCLFEGVNLNEGRGTERPFLQVGAPWLDPESVIKGLDREPQLGCKLAPVEYTPEPIAGKSSSPVYQGERCRGVSFQVTDVAAVRPFRLALSVLASIQKVHGGKLTWKDNFDVLAGGPWLRERLQAGANAAAIEGLYAARTAEFARTSPKLY
ncbi:MAG: DUF1343 domain-containing protein [Candidatus Hydrogenedentes bacterium]|nr:DUF1343 domain-containing protein [Candidatus Hydrogenedentota bacterium]